MIRSCVVIFCFALGANHLRLFDAKCTVSMTRDIPTAEPVYLQSTADGGMKLFIPGDEITELNGKEKLYLACPGAMLTGTERSFDEVTCFRSRSFRSPLGEPGKAFYLESANCTKVPDGQLLITKEKCSKQRGLIYHIGFEIENVFQTVFKMCYNIKIQRTYYVTHTVSTGISYKTKQENKKSWRAQGMDMKTVEVNRLYNKQHQIKIFKEMFGKRQKFVHDKQFLARGHLAPNADFMFSSFQGATYTYANAAPEFQSINNGNWKHIEALVREMAPALNRNLSIYSGHHGVLKLKKSLGKMIPIYLDSKKRFHAPELIYKVVKDDSSNAAIVFVTSNDPFTKSVTTICPDVCLKANVKFAKRLQYPRGYTYCCELSKFVKVVDDLPSDLKATKLLKVPINLRIFT